MALGNHTDTFITVADGLRLHARCYGPAAAATLPVVCLPGLARTAADFEALAASLASDNARPRRVIALDYRGRGQSDYDRNPDNYALPVELADVLAVVAALEAMPAVYVGTSRGGILTMLLATLRPTAIAGAILNDIGPVIEPKGLMRIKGYVGRLPQPATFEEGAEILRRLFDAIPQAHGGRLAGVLPSRLQTGKWEITADLRCDACEHAQGPQCGAASAVTLETVRCARPRAAHGNTGRQFRHPVDGDGRRYARTACFDRGCR